MHGTEQRTGVFHLAAVVACTPAAGRSIPVHRSGVRLPGHPLPLLCPCYTLQAGPTVSCLLLSGTVLLHSPSCTALSKPSEVLTMWCCLQAARQQFSTLCMCSLNLCEYMWCLHTFDLKDMAVRKMIWHAQMTWMAVQCRREIVKVLDHVGQALFRNDLHVLSPLQPPSRKNGPRSDPLLGHSPVPFPSFRDT